MTDNLQIDESVSNQAYDRFGADRLYQLIVVLYVNRHTKVIYRPPIVHLAYMLVGNQSVDSELLYTYLMKFGIYLQSVISRQMPINVNYKFYSVGTFPNQYTTVTLMASKKFWHNNEISRFWSWSLISDKLSKHVRAYGNFKGRVILMHILQF